LKKLKRYWQSQRFTTAWSISLPYTYTRTSADLCQVGGVGKVYTVEYLSGGGATQFSDLAYVEGKTSDRSTEIGSGIPSAPVITISTKGLSSLIIGTTAGQIYSQNHCFPAQPQRNPLLARGHSMTKYDLMGIEHAAGSVILGRETSTVAWGPSTDHGIRDWRLVFLISNPKNED